MTSLFFSIYIMAKPTFSWNLFPRPNFSMGRRFSSSFNDNHPTNQPKSDTTRSLPTYDKPYHEYANVVQHGSSSSVHPKKKSDPTTFFGVSYSHAQSHHSHPLNHLSSSSYPEQIKFSQEQLPLNSDWVAKEMKPGSIYQVHELGDDSKYENLDKTRKVDVFEAMGTDPIKMYKNVALLSQFVSETGMILDRKRTNLSIQNQRKLSKVIKRARAMGLLPYTSRLPLQSRPTPGDLFRYP